MLPSNKTGANQAKMIKHLKILLCVAAICCFSSVGLVAQTRYPIFCPVTIKFVHTANGKKIIQNDSTYISPDGEPYTISRLKYYISDLSILQQILTPFLIDAFATDSIRIRVPVGSYKKISFLLGVDSLLNSSGAQDGALDPLNNMFWTWNSGYVMFKLEGSSDSSHADLLRIEHHIGGYKGPYKTMRPITIKTDKPIRISRDKKTTIVLEMNLDKYWKNINSISISETPVIVVPGKLAKKAADNFPGMFTLKEIIYSQ